MESFVIARLLLIWLLATSAWGLNWTDPPHDDYTGRIIESSMATHIDVAPEERVRVYLPPGYAEDLQRTFPVLYALDGQNLFEPDMGDWELDEAMQRLILSGKMEPVIVVAVDTPEIALLKYYMPSRETWSEADQQWQGGHARDLLRFLLRLKGDIDGTFRTRREDTGIMGSSMGGLFALYAGFARPDVFRRVAALSPSLWWEHRERRRHGVNVVTDAQASEGPALLWMSMGDLEFSDDRDPPEVQQDDADTNMRYAREFTTYLRAHRAASRPYHFQPFPEDFRDQHREWAWKAQLDEVLPWLYKPGR